jgi:ribosome-binding protein aMBF1 (putative translation factor)
MGTTRNLLETLTEAERLTEGSGIDLRLDLSKLILEQLALLGWTQKELAKRAGMKEPFVTRVLNADSNCTFAIADRLLRALGIKASLAMTAQQPGKSRLL